MQQLHAKSDGPRTPDLREFVARAQHGSLDAFSELVRLFEGRLFNFLRVRTRCEHDAEDLTQETFLRAWRQLARYDDRYAFSTWLFTIGARLAVDRSRAASLPVSGESLHAASGAASAQPGPAAVLMQHEDHQNLWQLAEQLLGEQERSALWLRYAEAMSPANIAAVLGISQGNVRVMLHRARKQLMKHLQDEQVAACSSTREEEARAVADTTTGAGRSMLRTTALGLQP